MSTTSRKTPRKRVRCMLIAGIFLGVWGIALVWSYYVAHQKFEPGGTTKDAAALPKFHQRQVKEVSSSKSSQLVVVKDSATSAVAKSDPKNPWFGWQPAISATMECGWEECLAAQTKCRTCRQEPLGDPPPPVDNDWIPDVTMLHRMFLQGKDSNDKPWPPRVGGDICKDFWNGRDINKQLFQQVPVSIVAPPPAAKAPKGPKIFCGIYTMAKAHSLTIRAMRETWAPRCDGFLAFSTQSDPRIPAISITHEGPEEYNNMWQKSRAIWKFIGDHYLQEQEYDYFFLGGEDLFVIVDNLRAYLGTLASGPEEDHFVGRRFKGHGPDNYFNSGGAGYALSRGTLRKYIERGYDHPDCAAHRHTSMEDVMMAQCLRKVFGIGLTDTRDDKGRERFHPFAPGSHLTRKKDEHDWYNDYNKEWGIGYGTDCCAPDSVSFHYIKKATMVRHLHALLYECGDGTSKQ